MAGKRRGKVFVPSMSKVKPEIKVGDLVKYCSFARTGRLGFSTLGIVISILQHDELDSEIFKDGIYGYSILCNDGKTDTRGPTEVRRVK